MVGNGIAVTRQPLDRGTLTYAVKPSLPHLSLARHPFPALLAAIMMIAAACGGSGDDAGGSPNDDAPATTAAADSSAVSEAADSTEGLPVLDPSTFEGEAVTLDGEAYDLGQLANADLVVWFWAPW